MAMPQGSSQAQQESSLLPLLATISVLPVFILLLLHACDAPVDTSEDVLQVLEGGTLYLITVLLLAQGRQLLG